MMMQNRWRFLTLLLVLGLLVSVMPLAAQDDDTFTIGMLLVGPFNDRGWSQAHYSAGEDLAAMMDNVELIYLDRVNPADRPGTTADQLGEELLDQGADMLFFTSDDMKDAAAEFAENHPEVPVVHVSGDNAWEEGRNYLGLPNLGNFFASMVEPKAVAGCAAALTTETGQIGYLGPLINDETRRLVASAYLGARYCWEEYLGNDPADLQFRVDWIGFWFNIPGVTADPTQVADNFYNSGYDVVISGIDTTEGLVQARAATEAGNPVFNIPYDYEGACEVAPEVCLGVPAFNWLPLYSAEVEAAMAGTWEPSFQWPAPNFDGFFTLEGSTTGFLPGEAMSDELRGQIEQFVDELAGGLNLWTGPINLQDGTEYIAEGEEATPEQLWYLPQLLEGIEGQSVPE